MLQALTNNQIIQDKNIYFTSWENIDKDIAISFPFWWRSLAAFLDSSLASLSLQCGTNSSASRSLCSSSCFILLQLPLFDSSWFSFIPSWDQQVRTPRDYFPQHKSSCILILEIIPYLYPGGVWSWYHRPLRPCQHYECSPQEDFHKNIKISFYMQSTSPLFILNC